MSRLAIIFAAYLVTTTGAITLADDGGISLDPRTKLESLDKRIPVPLLPHMALHQKQNMREHLEAIQEITAGLAAKDFGRIASAASKMGYTPEMSRMCQHMGAGAEGFSDRAITFHRSADEIAVAARENDLNAVINKMAPTLAQCTSCHATFKQQVVGEEEMRKLTENRK